MDNFSEAIDPITGNINWDCPCMGDNPKGACGELFKDAFKCFVKNYDKENDTELPFQCKEYFEKMFQCQQNHQQNQQKEEQQQNLQEEEEQENQEGGDCGLCPEQNKLIDEFNKLTLPTQHAGGYGLVDHDLCGKVTSEQLGNSTWIFLHTMAQYYPDIPTENEKQSMINLINSLSIFYPCKHCAEHLKKYIQ